MEDTSARLAYHEFLNEWNSAADYVTAHSSGSTGTPKQLRLSKGDMLRSAAATVARFSLNPESVIASALPSSSIATKMAIVRSIVAGCTYLPIHPSNRLAIDSPVDLLSVAPSQTDYLIGHSGLSAKIGVVLVGGAPLSPTREKALMQAGYSVYETYGMTETCSNVALRQAGAHTFAANRGFSFSVDHRSCLTIHAPGYTFDGTVTNDVVELTSPTGFRWLGRYDNAINSGGIKIHPEMLERDLAPFISVPYYIVSAPDEKWGCVAVLVVEGSEQDAAEAAQALTAFPDRLRRPRQVRSMLRFERTHTGKVKRILPSMGKNS